MRNNLGFYDKAVNKHYGPVAAIIVNRVITICNNKEADEDTYPEKNGHYMAAISARSMSIFICCHLDTAKRAFRKLVKDGMLEKQKYITKFGRLGKNKYRVTEKYKNLVKMEGY